MQNVNYSQLVSVSPGQIDVMATPDGTNNWMVNEILVINCTGGMGTTNNETQVTY